MINDGFAELCAKERDYFPGWVAQISLDAPDAGVAEDARDEIFTAFRRGEGSRSTGIGLAICRSIVEAHGGAIGVERTFGGGATFWFTLPAAGGPR